MTPKIPYPARRKYMWAYPQEVHTYEQARDLFVRMRRQAPETDNPARFKALTLALEALAHLSHHQGVEAFPGPKLHKLLCKSALAADWCPDLGAKQREACAQPVEGSPDMYRCPKCREIKPLADFLKPVTAAQRTMWGWDNAHSARTTKAKTCKTCRVNAEQRKIKHAERVDARRAAQRYQDAVAAGGVTSNADAMPLVFDYWTAMFPRLIHATRMARSKSIHPQTKEFYRLKFDMLALAKERFDTAADAGQLAPYAVPAPHWTLFLDKDELLEIQLAHVRMTTTRRQDDVRGKLPEL